MRTCCPGDARQYTINNDNVAKSAEKLSSGYRINRAGDDAAGLAISEKMRSQIRGLNMATKNSQDAISLVQTAEGALQETHSMLQRMNELAVQAATGTNQEEDRMALAKEFEQLKKEINDIAEQTTFNNMKVLDGSMSYAGYVRSAQTAGVTNTVTENSAEIPKSAVNINEIDAAKAASDDYDPTTGAQASFQIALSGTGFTGVTADSGVAASGPAANDGGTAKLTITYGGKDYTLESNQNTGGTDATTAAAVAALFNGTTVDIDGVTYDVANNSGTLTLTAQTKADTDFSGANAPTVTSQSGGTATVTGTPTSGVKSNGEPAVAQKNSVTVDFDKLQVGDKISIGTTDYTYADGDDIDDVVTALSQNAAVTVTKVGDNGFTVTANTAGPDNASDAKVTFTAKADADAATAGTAEYKYTNTIEFDTVKMKDGDVFSILGEEVSFEDVPKGEGDTTTANNMASAFQQAIQAKIDSGDLTGISVEAKGNALIIKSNEKLEIGDGKDIQLTSDATKADATKDDYKTNAIRIQVGALEDEQLAVSIDSMNTAGLGLDDQDLFTQNNAGRAITAVRAAVQKVSDQRATLGAMQNRLDHKIANLKVSSENLSAAESRIRDVDMAEEMTNFTKNNILSQAATAMLAQANALPQNVLSLLG